MNSQRFLTGLLIVTLLIVSLGAHPAEAARRKKHHVYRQRADRYAAIVVEASTGYVLSAQNADKRLYPASLTKMMTLYLAFEAMAQGKLDKHDRLPVSRRASRQEPSSLGLQAGDSIRVEDAILSIATKSANDSAVVLAEAIGGTEEHFARDMTATARRLGMPNTRFVNASGLFNRSQYSSARDMATLARAIIRDYPKYYRYFSTSAFTYRDETYFNHNRLMSSYQGMDGLKTGYVYASGYNLAASAVRNGTRLIGVVFGGRTARSRNSAMARLLNQSFVRIRDIRVADLVGRTPSQPVPIRRPASLESTVETASADNAASAVEVPATGPVDQGDAAITEDKKAAPASEENSVPAQTAGNLAGGWAIQLGAFSSRDASLRALEAAKTTLPGLRRGTRSIAAPLMTRRGMVYRARLSGLDRGNAARACSILRGACLVLTAE